MKWTLEYGYLLQPKDVISNYSSENMDYINDDRINDKIKENSTESLP